MSVTIIRPDSNWVFGIDTVARPPGSVKYECIDDIVIKPTLPDISNYVLGQGLFSMFGYDSLASLDNSLLSNIVLQCYLKPDTSCWDAYSWLMLEIDSLGELFVKVYTPPNGSYVWEWVSLELTPGTIYNDPIRGAVLVPPIHFNDMVWNVWLDVVDALEPVDCAVCYLVATFPDATTRYYEVSKHRRSRR